MKTLQLYSPAKASLRIILLLVMVLASLGPSGTSVVYAAPPNDNFAFAETITGLTYIDTENTTTATSQGSGDSTAADPQPVGNGVTTCTGTGATPKRMNRGNNTIWYQYTTPSVGQTITVDTIGSAHVGDPGNDIDTYLAVWTGPANGSNLSLVTCNDDNNVGQTSQLSFVGSANTTYYIQVASYNCYYPLTGCGVEGGGNVVFHAYITNTDVNIGDLGSPSSLMGSYYVPAGSSKRVTYNLDSGPVKITSTSGTPIIAALRDAYYVNGQLESFAQLMGLPREQLSDTYYFPAYNNVTLDGQLRFANVDTIATVVTVTIGGIDRGMYPLQPSETERVNYALDTGPVVIKSSNGAKLIAALRDAYIVNGQIESYVQLMGLPEEQLSDTYYFPAYNNVTLDGQLRFGNVDTVPTTVTVTIGGIPRGSYPLQPSESKRVTFPLDTGPVVISSSGGAKIIAALRDAYYVNGQLESFAQLMGLPEEALSDAYNFPAYNNITLSGQLRFGNVDTIATDVTVTIGGTDRGTYTLQPSESKRVTYPLDTGPVVIHSSNGANLIAALRDAYYVNNLLVSFVQLMGLPFEDLSDTYYFPAYNNITLSGQLRFGVP